MTKTFRLKDINCTNCAAQIEAAIAKIDGVKNVSFDFLTEKLVINASESKFEKIIPEVKKVCKKIDPHTIFVDFSK